MDKVDQFIDVLLTGDYEMSFAPRFALEEGITNEQLYNTAMLEIARRFHSDRMDYEDADHVANCIWSFMINDASHFGDGFELAQPAFAIYEAFDAGEYDRGDGRDPVEHYCKPAIAQVLAEA